MNNDKKKQQQSKILIGLIIVAAVQIVPALLSVTGMSEGTAAVIAVLFLMAFVWLIFFTIFKKLRSAGKFPPSASGAKGAANKGNVEFSDGIAGIVERMAKRDEEEVRRYQGTADRDCEYGDENHSFSHDSEQRLAQLDDFLKNGIIDRAEYQVLKKRYSQSDNK